MKNEFDQQELLIHNEKWQVRLNYESWYFQPKELEPKDSDIVIHLSEEGQWDSILKLSITHNEERKTCYIKGIQGGSVLHAAENNSSQSVKLEHDHLILCLGFDFLSLNLNTLTLNWTLKPDLGEVFDFHDLQSDYLLRGELEIHRIDPLGNIKWAFSGADIWVNMEGKPEVQINENTITLLDFNSDEYLIDFDGKPIKD